jgi:hypothetical protein
MKNYHQFVLSAFAALAVLTVIPVRADNMASIGITPATGVVTLAPRWGIGSGLAGFHHMSQDLGLGGQANNFYSIISAEIPMGGNVSAFNLYVAASGFATSHADIGSKLTPYSYSALTSADPDVGYGSVNLYFIHHKSTGDYFSVLVPGSSVSSSITDLKPMDGPGGPATLGTSGYFGLTFASGNLGYGLNQFYYLRTHAVTGDTIFGTLNPGLLSTSADQFSLGTDGHVALAFTGANVGYGTDKMYYLRQDPVTGYTILGMLNPSAAATRHTSDIANLGSVFTTLTFTASDLGFGVNKFYTTGSINPTWQSVSFAAIADRAVIDGSFTVNPTASSGLPIVLTVVTGSATISSPVGGVFTVTPTAGGLVTLQATQVGAINPTPYEYNMLRQSFMVSGTPMASFDFNTDGQSDILFRETATGRVIVWLMNGTTRASYTDISTTLDWEVCGSGDFNNDGQSDILWRETATGRVIAWLMDGTTRLSYADISTAPGWEVRGSSDFNNDGHSDVLFREISTGRVIVWFMNGTTRVSYTDISTAPGWDVRGIGDFNNDGQSDILWRETSTGRVIAWLMNGTTRASYTDITTTLEWDVRGTGDFNNDGQSDILFREFSTGRVIVWLMNGTTRASYTDITTTQEWQVMNR